MRVALEAPLAGGRVPAKPGCGRSARSRARATGFHRANRNPFAAGSAFGYGCHCERDFDLPIARPVPFFLWHTSQKIRLNLFLERSISLNPTMEATLIRTALTDLLGITHPIVSAPMGGVSGGALAAAVTAAGGLGLVGVSYGDAEFISRELPIAAGAGGVWGAGLVLFTLDERPGVWEQVLSYSPPVLALSFGDAVQTAKYVAAGRASGAHVLVQIHDLDQARVAVEAGASALIAQGAEAGGHHADRSTFPLVPAVADLVGGRIPVVAAGGIADGRGLAAALALGADGAMVGTRFAASSESLAAQGFREQLIKASAADTMNTRAFDIVREIPWDSAYQARAIANAFAIDWQGRESDLTARAREVKPGWAAAAGRDDVTQQAMFAGEVVDIVNEILPAGEIVLRIADGASVAVRSLVSRSGIPA